MWPELARRPALLGHTLASWPLHLGFWILDSGFWILGFLGLGFWDSGILGFFGLGFWGSGFWILDSVLGSFSSRTWATGPNGERTCRTCDMFLTLVHGNPLDSLDLESIKLASYLAGLGPIGCERTSARAEVLDLRCTPEQAQALS